MLLIECLLVIAALPLALAFPNLGNRRFQQVEGLLRQLAYRRWLAVFVIGILALILRAALLPILPVPEPIIHDEFGYLLAADTFSHGHLTNPTHPMWMHFETFSVLQKPTYQCYAQPAQGLILAFGQVVFGHPFWGVWLSAGLMCAAICWMLQGWLPETWAFVGGAIAVLRIGTLTYWANSYWGGAAAAIAGALTLGALPRIIARHRVRDSVLMGFGIAVLANSRPYEGLILSVPVAIALLIWMSQSQRHPLKVILQTTVLPLSLVIATAALGTCYYFWRVTGNPFRLPYQVAQQTYGVAPYMIWQGVRSEPVFNHAVLRSMYTAQVKDDYQIARSAAGPLSKAVQSWQFFVGPAFTLPFLLAILTLPYGFSWKAIDKRHKFLIATAVVFAFAVAAEVFFSPHYAAPATALIVALIVMAMRQLSSWQWHGKPVGLSVSRAVILIALVMFCLRIFAVPLHIRLSRSHAPAWYQLGPATFGRDRLAEELELKPGKQLVIVKYTATHDPFKEWVHNDANIDSAKVVWARDMGPEKNRELINYFPDRQALLIEPDKDVDETFPYPGCTKNGETLRLESIGNGKLQ